MSVSECVLFVRVRGQNSNELVLVEERRAENAEQRRIEVLRYIGQIE